ncbi:3' terminal RNA ribose 2'-O-methyltransferase Hen1 [Streptomonospora sp. S1-112]|uniref:Small RNA 2'-O-methyltransferase n=1 Tax=Streptomonospora mangrovi TaxID=2883123 RepID=A0A9X3NKS5_9ACTN|nr:3' terminal RNA ribose 2'-O-methyltransferase Hen1 [Streptomonospora mangrovi]MDA0565522.1 3' terminal RNA ribose 2'-O-methyltransferase Hen1 [Streptomonospora mangrovi]
MLLTITTTRPPATDLGFLLHKHPDRVQRFEQSYGTAHVFYPEARADRCTAALLLEVDPQALLRTRKSGAHSPDFSLAQYVNDRPYAASSLFAVALGDVFRSALRGRSAVRPDLAASALPLTLSLPAVPCRGGPDLARRLFEPLGWRVDADPVALDPGLPDWGDSHYVSLTLTGDLRLADALSHLYVLLPVLDGHKHYWVSADEVDKLLRAGEGWLAAHPERAWITRRYLARRTQLLRTALARLSELDDLAADPGDPLAAVPDTVATEPGEEEPPTAATLPGGDAEERESAPTAPGMGGSGGPGGPSGSRNPVGAESPDGTEPPERARAPAAPEGAAGPDPAAGRGARDAVPEAAPDAATGDAADDADASAPGTVVPGAAAPEPVGDRGPSLAERRAGAVLAVLQAENARSVLDLGCGPGRLLARLLDHHGFDTVAGSDVSAAVLEQARRRLRLDRRPEHHRRRLTLFTASALYTDPRFRGYDAAVLMEVIEHVDPPRLPALAHVVFGDAAPRTVVVTTPNVEYNVRYPTLPHGAHRHTDHRFEWTRAEFRAWADDTAAAYGYRVRYLPVGPEDPEVGASTQMGVFTK